MTSAWLTDKEVQKILKYFNLSEHYADIREWYDGYHFGNTEYLLPVGCNKILQEPVCRSYCKAAGLLVKFKRKCSGKKLH